MSKMLEFIAESVPNQETANELMLKLYDVSDPKAVYSPPLEVGEFTVITAAEVSVGLGFGFGGGGSLGEEVVSDEENEESGEAQSVDFGSGGGGGGGAVARPVAVIEIGPNGVRVEPIVDPTKIAVAFFTTLLGIFAMGSKMRRSRLP